MQIIVDGLSRAVALDIHYNQGYIFWSDVTEMNIKRANIDGSSITVIHNNIGVCEGLAVEWNTSQLYWTDKTNGAISVSDFEGNNKTILVSSNLDEPRGIVLDHDSGLMFWTSSGQAPKIERATLSGTQRVAIVTSNLQAPAGIDLDRRKGLVFWVDGGLERIEVVDYNGNNRKLIFHPANSLQFFGATLLSSSLFVTEWSRKGVWEVVDASSADDVSSINGVTFGGIDNIMGIVAYDSSRQVPVITCPALPAPSNGTRLGCPGNATMYYNTTCQFSCNNGYIGSGSQVRRCQQDGTWSGQNFTCQIINCTTLTEDPSAPLRMSSCDNHYGSQCNFSCTIGHRLNGSSTVTCVASGNQYPGLWNNSIPTCEAITCPALPAPSNGTRLGCPGNATMYYNTSCQFSCNNGYIGSGSQVRRCQHNGTWSGQDFTCQIINCTSLTVDPSSPLRMSSCNNLYGSECDFSCTIGHRLNGSSAVTCVSPGNQHPGIWDNTIPTCEVITCPALPAPSNGTRLGCPGNATMYYNTSCQFSCNNGYIGSGSQRSRVQRYLHRPMEQDLDAQGMQQFINCTTLTEDPSAPLRMSSCDNHYGSQCNFSCTIGHRLNGSSTVTCVAPGNKYPGLWNNSIPTCEAITCPALPAPSNGTRLGCPGNATMYYNTSCQFSCNNGYIGSGSQVRRCQHNGTWSGQDFTCQIINCTSLTVDPSSPLRMSSCNNLYGSECDFSCTIGHRLNGSSAVTCVAPGNQHPGIWDNTIPTCEVITCPALPAPSNGTRLGCPGNATMYYNTSCQFSCNNGYIGSGSQVRRCQHNGTWSGQDFTCQIINCTSLTVDSSGTLRMSSCKNHYGAQCSFSCAKGYRLNGSSAVTCVAPGNQHLGVWNNAIPTCEKISLKETEESILLEVQDLDVKKWNKQMEDDFKTEVARVATDYCTADGNRCQSTSTSSRRKRSSNNLVFSKNMVHILPEYPKQLSKDPLIAQLAFYLKSPQRLSDDTVRKNVLQAIVKSDVSSIGRSMNGTIMSVKALFSTKDPTAKSDEKSKSMTAIIIGACVGGALLLVVVIVAVVCACKRRSR
ncbi:P-selectin-like [Oculina patagonica]